MGVAIGIGIMDFPFAAADSFWRWVDQCEDSAIDSIWQTDRIISERSILESMTTMAALAGRTRRIKFGVNVWSLAFRDPVLLAKQCATVDFLSNGRLLPAFGIGNPRSPEWKARCLETKGRGRRTDEGLEIIHLLWHEDNVDYDGRYYKLSGATISPKPVQKKLPMWIGGMSDAAVRRTARYGTGWQAGLQTPDEVATTIRAIREAVVAHGRSIDDDHYGAGFPFYFGDAEDPAPQQALTNHRERTGQDGHAYICVGGGEEIVGRIGEYIAAGASKFVLRPIGADDEDLIRQTQLLIEQVLPVVEARWPRR
ncbi:MAG: LLM class flavin-dependent oxidoreductase [Hyphomicrobiaceae bacterium]